MAVGAQAEVPMFGLGGKAPTEDLCFVIKGPQYLSRMERMGTSIKFRHFVESFGGDQASRRRPTDRPPPARRQPTADRPPMGR